MRIGKEYTAGFVPAMRAMRNPMNSWSRGDTRCDTSGLLLSIGEKDLELSRKLYRAGPEHAKHLRMIQVWSDFELPRYIWQEWDTYTFQNKISTSTMHRIDSRLLTMRDFEDQSIEEGVLKVLNGLITSMQECENGSPMKNEYRRIIKKRLPEGFLQIRTVNLSYASLANVYNQRKNHKLPEWKVICAWILSLPYFKELTGIE